jgi:hypothetical protein
MLTGGDTIHPPVFVWERVKLYVYLRPVRWLQGIVIEERIVLRYKI